MIKNDNPVTTATNLLMDSPVPVEIAQQAEDKSFCNEKEQVYTPTVHLFFSFDIVNSTQYKALTPKWPLIIESLLKELPFQVSRKENIRSSFLWRVIGDEMVFVLPIQSEKEIPAAVDDIFAVLQSITISLRNGKFYDNLEDQRLQKSDIDVLKSHNTLSLKAAAWITVINDKLDCPYDNILVTYVASSNNPEIKEYLGKDIDAGFRLKGYTQDRRLAVSFELAYFLANAKQSKKLHIIDYVRLKGVWNDNLYPVIWYHNSDIVECDKEIPFEKSFRYDEADDNLLLQAYFSRIEKQQNGSTNNKLTLQGAILSNDMYEVDSALYKIYDDKNMEAKINYIKKWCNKELFVMSHNLSTRPLELHCAVVCCDVEKKQILIIKRSDAHSSNPKRWEFGCAKAISQKTLVSTIKHYYEIYFGVKIELVINKERTEQQPLPIAIYEIDNGLPAKKGIIFVGKLIEKISNEGFRGGKEHEEMKWITQDELSQYHVDKVIPDFHATAKTVFENFDNYFLKGD